MTQNVFWNVSEGPFAPRWIQNSWPFPPRDVFMRKVKKRLPTIADEIKEVGQ